MPDIPAGRSRLARISRRLLRGATSIYLMLSVIMYFGQNWLIFPGAADQGKAETRIDFRSEGEILHLKTTSGVPITAIFGPARQADGSPDPDANQKPTILYFYGNAGSIAWSENEFDHFRELGVNVMIPDFAGYGQSGGKPSEKAFVETADASWDYLQHRSGIDGKKIIVVGWSLGAGVAVDLADRKPVAGLATFNAFTTLPAMAHRLFPWLPTSLLLKYRFDNEAKMPRIHCPMLICNGAQDTLIPAGMSDRLAAVAGGPVTRLTIESANHNSIFTAEPDVVWPAMSRLISGIAAVNTSPK